MHQNMSKDILRFLIYSDSSCYLFHRSCYVNECILSISIASHNNQSIIGKQITALKAFLCKEVDSFIGGTNSFYFVFP